MKKRIGACLLLLCLLLLLCVLAGCAKSAPDRWFQARANLTAAQDATVVANEAGWISDDDFVNVVAPAARTARGYLDESFKLLPEGGSAFDNFMRLLDQIILELNRQAAAPSP